VRSAISAATEGIRQHNRQRCGLGEHAVPVGLDMCLSRPYHDKSCNTKLSSSGAEVAALGT